MREQKDAIKEALASTERAAPYAARRRTDWLLLEVIFTPPQAAVCYYEKILAHSKERGLDCHRFWGDIMLAFVDHEWSMEQREQMDMRSWLQQAIVPSYSKQNSKQFKACSDCQECGGKQTATCQDWCATCWNQHYLKRVNPLTDIGPAGKPAAGMTAATQNQDACWRQQPDGGRHMMTAHQVAGSGERQADDSASENVLQ